MSEINKINETIETLEMAGTSAEIDSLDAIMEKELAKDEPKEEVVEEFNCPFQYKDEVRFKPKRVPKLYKKVKGLKHGKIGRVLKIIADDKVLVDFWDTHPVKIPMDVKHLELETSAAEVALRAAPMTEEVVEVEPENPKADEGVKAPTGQPVKLDMGKLRMDLIRPEFLKELAAGLTYGAEKYDEKVGEVNFLKGDGHSYNRIYAALQRHLNAWMAGENVDPESGVHHLSLASANLMMLVTYENSNVGVDDRVRI